MLRTNLNIDLYGTKEDSIIMRYRVNRNEMLTALFGYYEEMELDTLLVKELEIELDYCLQIGISKEDFVINKTRELINHFSTKELELTFKYVLGLQAPIN